MMCLFCKKPMAIRSGPHGDFYYCQYGNHGTISADKYKAIVNQLPKDGLPIGGKDPLMQAVERTQAALGYGAMTDLERFYIDSPVYDEMISGRTSGLMDKRTRGGAGRGQGRKPIAKTGELMKARPIRMTDEEWEKCRRLGGASWVRAKIKGARET